MTQYTPAQKRAIEKYLKTNVDRIYLTVPAGRKAVYQEAAKAAGKSLNAYIVDCIEAALNAEGKS